MDGATIEREIVGNFYEEYGGAAIRIPASGGRTKRELPDVIGKAQGVSYAIESKAVSNKYTNFKVDECKKLITFAYKWGAVPVLTSRFSHDTNFYAFVCLTPSTLPVANKDVKTFSFKKPERKQMSTLKELIEGERNKTPRDVYDKAPEYDY